MKFNRSDIGLYTALGIAGAGIGLLVGAAVHTWYEGRKERRRFEKELELQHTEDDTEISIVVDIPKPEHYIDPDPEDLPETAEEKRLAEEFDIHLKEFIDYYSPDVTNVHIAMLRAGAFDFDELEKLILTRRAEREDEKSTNKTNYSSQYQLDDDTDYDSAEGDIFDEDGEYEYDDVEVFDEEDETLHTIFADLTNEYDDEFLLMESYPRKVPREARVLWDQRNKKAYIESARGFPVKVNVVPDFVSQECWDDIRLYLGETEKPLFVERTRDGTVFLFSITNPLPSSNNNAKDELDDTVDSG